MESSVLVPITIWNGSQPTFRVSSVRITPNGRKLITSSIDGQLSIWDVNLNELEINPRCLLLGHSDSVTCLECTDEYAVSASEGGEICRWNLDDGHCTKSVQSVFVHRRIQLFKSSRLDEDLLFACGDYHEIFIIHSSILQTLLVLHSKSDSDWISCFYVMSSLEIGNDVVSAVTKSSFIKLWIIEELSDDYSYEVQSSLLPVKNVSQIKCSLTQTQILVICDISWTIFDAKYLKTICSSDRISNEKFIGGDFFDSDVLVWTNEKKFYLFKLGVEGASLKKVFTNDSQFSSLFEPSMYFQNSGKEKFLVQCDFYGKISFWNVAGSEYESKPILKCDLSLRLNVDRSKIFDRYVKDVTCCIAITGLDLLAVGCSDGTIIAFSASRTLSCNEMDSVDEDCRTLTGHKGRINCLLYPHDKYPSHNKSYLLSGGSDFSVCLWDLTTYKLIHRFCVQSGEIIKLLVPPMECKQRIRNSICSVASDHSVAILNLKELKCIVLASRQVFPVVTINWRPLDDFLIIECFDGTVYIWEMETGHLDRVLHGVTAQEVIYACKDANHEKISNFYLREDSVVGKDHFRVGLFQVEKDFSLCRTYPFLLFGFRDSFNSENQIIAFNLGGILDSIRGNQPRIDVVDQKRYSRDHALTQGYPTAVKKPKEVTKTVEDGTVKDIAVFLLSMLRDWRDDQVKRSPLYTVISDSQNVSVFLSKLVRTPTITTINTVALLALTSTLESDESYLTDDSELDVETLARLWQNQCTTIRSIARNLLLSKLKSQTMEERSALLRRWFKYLPHFPTVDGMRLDESDPEIMEMRVVSLVLFGVIGADFKFKLDNPSLEETYMTETCAAILHSIQDSNNAELQVIATNILGRGYAVWDSHVKFEKIIRLLFEMTHEYEQHCYNDEVTLAMDKCIFAHETLISIAIARTESFMNCETREIAQIRSSQSVKSDSTFMEKSKTEMILIVTDLLSRTPYIMLRYLNDVVTVLLYCINPNHLKQEVIGNLIAVLNKFRQVHHCLATHRIAVGLQDGNVAIHELKTFKMHKIVAHGDAVNAVSFSPDGKVLATYCFFENKLSFWHVFATMFGLGHVNIKSLKTYETNKIGDENIRNHLEIAELAWVDNKSVILRLCDGTQTVYHV